MANIFTEKYIDTFLFLNSMLAQIHRWETTLNHGSGLKKKKKKTALNQDFFYLHSVFFHFISAALLTSQRTDEMLPLIRLF